MAVRTRIFKWYTKLLVKNAWTHQWYSTCSQFFWRGRRHFKVELVFVLYKQNRLFWPGYRLSRTEVVNYTIDARRNLNVQATQMELPFFTGLWNVFRQFVPNFPRFASSLKEKLRKSLAKEVRKLSKEGVTTLQRLSEKLIYPPIVPLSK